MKKLLSLSLIAVLSLSLAACKKEKIQTDTAETGININVTEKVIDREDVGIYLNVSNPGDEERREDTGVNLQVTNPDN